MFRVVLEFDTSGNFLHQGTPWASPAAASIFPVTENIRRNAILTQDYSDEIIVNSNDQAELERPTAAEIQRRMSLVRAEIGEDVYEVVESSKSLTDWRAYVRANPIAFTIGAVVFGYLLIPRKVEYIRPDTAELVKAIKKEKLVVAPKSKVSGKNSLTGSLLGMVAATATRAVAAQLFAGFLANQSGQSDESAVPARRAR